MIKIFSKKMLQKDSNILKTFKKLWQISSKDNLKK